ncbi:MAG TPA: FHA domain-containing protein, partial [Polyangia bacterium]
MKDDDDREETHVSDPGRALNNRTVIAGGVRPLRADARPLGARDAFLAAHPGMRVLATRPDVAVVVGAVDPDGRVIGLAPLAAGQALIAGRHTRCGLRLPSDDASLRHLAIHVRVEGGGPVTRLWDLGTSTPFEMEDGAAATAVIAEGPLFAAVAGYALLCVPAAASAPAVWTPGPAAAWDALPPRGFIDLRTTAPARARHRPDPDLSVSRISRIDAPSRLGAEPADGPPWAELTLTTPGAQERHPISAEQISRGVLIGRYPRCLAGTGAAESLSRVHLLIVRIGDEVWAIDTASTNGTERHGHDIDAVVLAADDELELPGDA